MPSNKKSGKALPPKESAASPVRKQTKEDEPKPQSPYKKYFGGENAEEAEAFRKKKKHLANKDIRTGGRFAHN